MTLQCKYTQIIIERVFNSTQYDYNIIAYILITKKPWFIFEKRLYSREGYKITDLKL